MTGKLDEEVEEMCNFSDVYMEEGLARGMEKGMVELAERSFRILQVQCHVCACEFQT